MSFKKKLSLIACFTLFSNSIFAELPPALPGFYTGLIVMGSMPINKLQPTLSARPISPTISSSPFTPTLVYNSQGTLTHGPLGGAGGELGYRFPCFRLEGEFLYNINRTTKLTFPSTTFSNNKHLSQYYITYATQEYFALGNFYYDLRPSKQKSVGLGAFPYFGVGAGYAQFISVLNFAVPRSTHGATKSGPNYVTGTKTRILANAPVIQGIAGFDMPMDSYMDFFFDFRYLISSKISAYDRSFQIATLNLGVHFLLDKGL